MESAVVRTGGGRWGQVGARLLFSGSRLRREDRTAGGPEELRRTAEPLRRWVGDTERASVVAAWITNVRLPETGVTGAPRGNRLEEVPETQPPTWGDRMRVMGHEQGRDVGRAEGRQEGRAEERRKALRRKPLLRVARFRYGGGQVGALSAMLDRTTDTDLLEGVAEWLLVRDSGDALMARLRQV